MIWIPWKPWIESAIVPARAVETLQKFNHNYNHAPLIRCRDCEYGRAIDSIGCILLSSEHTTLKEPNGFCAWAEPRKACRNADENAADFADAPTLKPAREPMHAPVFELGA